MHPDLTEAAQCLQDTEAMLQSIKTAMERDPRRHTADRRRHYNFNLLWVDEMLAKARNALNRADRFDPEADTSELWQKQRRLRRERNDLECT